jgi:phenylpyruvate tautomerase PptA (4-oxalocrotonate tautomerase family)
MPLTRISANFSIPNKTSLVNDVQNTLVNVLKIPAYDRLIIVDENQKGFFQPLNTAGKYVLVELSMFRGRTKETKQALYKSLVDVLEKHGIGKNNVRIVIYDVPKDNWGIRGGQMASEVEMGFETER